MPHPVNPSQFGRGFSPITGLREIRSTIQTLLFINPSTHPNDHCHRHQDHCRRSNIQIAYSQQNQPVAFPFRQVLSPTTNHFARLLGFPAVPESSTRVNSVGVSTTSLIRHNSSHISTNHGSLLVLSEQAKRSDPHTHRDCVTVPTPNKFTCAHPNQLFRSSSEFHRLKPRGCMAS